MSEDIFNGVGVEVSLKDPQNFLMVKETLTRIGVSSQKDNTLYQSCHLLHKRGRYAVVHFKEMFILDGKTANFTEQDKGRRNAITNLLEQWGLVKVLEPESIKSPIVPISMIKVIRSRDKHDWNLVAKYQIGRKNGSNNTTVS